MTRITLLTDFGTADGYVGAMKGVIASIAPEAVVDDVAHDLPPGDVRAAAWTLARYWRLYPAGTVHVAVVDPGVGSERRALAASCDGRLLLAPDNGVLTRVFDEAPPAALVSIEDRRHLREPVSATFHGRDVFAPAAAHLARGLPVADLGPAVRDPLLFQVPPPSREADSIHGEVVHVDRFGNLITNIPGEWCAGGAAVRVGQDTVGAVRRTYSDVVPGEALALVGSAGLLEISVRDGSAAERLGVGRGAAVEVK
ncbi:MAG: SAM-dependent chlorinase/fluorinase [Gemmatimonadetes bacterium]|nr:SAM-dependent chlorinase/fluorinase [Gemmatimonadota bacterium]